MQRSNTCWMPTSEIITVEFGKQKQNIRKLIFMQSILQKQRFDEIGKYAYFYLTHYCMLVIVFYYYFMDFISSITVMKEDQVSGL